MPAGRLRPSDLVNPETATPERRWIMSEDAAKNDVTPAWLDYRQSEAYSNLSRTTLWSLIKARKIRAARVGRAVRIERASLQAFMERSSDEIADP